MNELKKEILDRIEATRATIGKIATLLDDSVSASKIKRVLAGNDRHLKDLSEVVWERMSDQPTHDPAAQWRRLKRIEEAAREVVENCGRRDVDDGTGQEFLAAPERDTVLELRDALEGDDDE